MACTLCGASSLRVVYELADAPVTCTSIFDSVAEARAVPCGRIDLAVCQACGFAHNAAFDPGLAQLGSNYASSQGASAHFKKFADDLASAWVARHGLTNEVVLEVGCGDGEFLQAMTRAGAAAGIGVDPLAPARSVDPTLRFVGEEFSESHHAFDAKALLCRHTLEHVAAPGAFLALVRQWAAARPGRVVLFELPAAEYQLAECAFWDIYYEHCNYFTGPVLRDAFARAGLQVTRCERVYGDQYFIVEAVAGSGGYSFEADAVHEGDRWSAFSARARQATDRCRSGFSALAESGRALAIWQGAAKTVGVLSACGPLDSLDCAVDLNAERHGRFLPGSGLLVQAPAYLRSIDPGHVVLMNAVYRSEVQASLDALGLDAGLLTINDLCDGLA